MDSPLVSVILPCFNAENFIFDALNSILQQSYKNLEIIVIDDGSSDSSMTMISSLLKADERITLIKNGHNIGLIKTLNKGIKLAKGTFIARMDADDLSHLHRIEKQVHFFNNNSNVDVVGTKSTPIDINGNPINREFTFYTESQTLKFSVLFTQPFFHGSVLAKSSVLKENNYSEEYKHSEDFELWNRLSAKNYKLTNLKEALYVYRVNPHGVSKKFESVQIESHNNASAIYMGLFLNMKIDPSIVAFLNNRPTAISIKNIKLAKQLCKKLKTLLLENETIESNNYYHNHLLNVYLQALKFVSNKITKVYLVKQIFSILFKSNNLAYLRKKLNR